MQGNLIEEEKDLKGEKERGTSLRSGQGETHYFIYGFERKGHSTAFPVKQAGPEEGKEAAEERGGEEGVRFCGILYISRGDDLFNSSQESGPAQSAGLQEDRAQEDSAWKEGVCSKKKGGEKEAFHPSIQGKGDICYFHIRKKGGTLSNPRKDMDLERGEKCLLPLIAKRVTLRSSC